MKAITAILGMGALALGTLARAETVRHDHRTGAAPATNSAWSGVGVNVDLLQVGRTLGGGWSRKEGLSATEYDSAGSRYRTWKPEAQKLAGPGGLKVSTRIDHIRTAKYDDPCTLRIRLNERGGVTQVGAKVSLGPEAWEPEKILGEWDSFDIEIQGSGEPSAQGTKDLGEKLKAAVARKIKDTASRGRKNIPAVLLHNYTVIMANVRIGPRVDDHRGKDGNPLARQADPDDGGEIHSPEKLPTRSTR